MSVHVLADRRRRRTMAKWDTAPLVGWRQLCAIAREQQQPDFGEWKARVQDRLTALGFRHEPELVRRAQDAVARAHGHQLPIVAKPAAIKLTPAPLNGREGAALLREIRRRVEARRAP